MAFYSSLSGGLPLRLGLVGRGHIGGTVISELTRHCLPIEVVGVIRRRCKDELDVLTLDELVDRSPHVVVEAAGQAAAKEFVPQLVCMGIDVVLLSVGAMCDPAFEQLVHRGPGRLYISTGAIAGLDGLRAHSLSSTIKSVTLTSTTLPSSLLQPWMSATERGHLVGLRDSEIVFEGPARFAATKFPQVANVSATVGLASLGLDAVRVQLVGDPRATRKTHEIVMSSNLGELRVLIENTFATGSRTTSASTSYAVLRLLSDLVSRQLIA